MCLVYITYGGCGHKMGVEIEPCSDAEYPNPCRNAIVGDKNIEVICYRCRYVGYTGKKKSEVAERDEADSKKTDRKQADTKEARGKEVESK
ncbi:hypothetical protein EMCG_05195 [[Emmonsia] crescens]|uniref:Uncharacterized protein n=1 Tax=[Emmonsia] crescens TaxID=73230 RepID=A0A0G2HPU9_9EURO|nr:hypothetical protein EMCG_05195 [Emmonsia crescens UAMH 3008]